jgi:hypothetical protein
MTAAGGQGRSDKRRSGKAGPAGRAFWTPVLFSALAIWLAWQIVLGPVAQRAPPELAARLAPTSALVLSRAAESEFAAGRVDNADFLARERLKHGPFDVRALRVAGMAADKAGRPDQANDILTLAGNWSLRDDPTHAWLIDRRLRQGDYSSAFAHADTLVRRREDIQPRIFQLFTLAATSDRRAQPVVTGLLAARPPWSRAYFDHLYQTGPGLQLATNLALGLQETDGPMDDIELRRLYYYLLQKVDPSGVAAVRTRLKRPIAPAGVIVSGDFETGAGVQPFAWRLGDQAGLIAEVVPAPDAGNALYVAYQGFGADALVDQLVALAPGTYELRGLEQTATAENEARLAWTVTCAGAATGRIVVAPLEFTAGDRPEWRRFSRAFTVPEAGCPVQWVRLDAPNRDRRRELLTWFDDLIISRRSMTQ